MARTVDPAKHEARRLQIIDAALTRFATDGYERATTAAICKTADIGSGTFFHYFPTKSAVLVAILEYGTYETREWFAARQGRTDAREVLLEYVAHSADEYADERVAGFIHAVVAVMGEPDIAAALAADVDAVRDCLAPWFEMAQQRGEIREDLTPVRATRWLMVLLDGFLDRIISEPDFTVATEKATLLDAVDRLLAP
ncbi:MAG: TetR/AcrR family transcriptional regulator [Propionibacteriaceae bacterium]